MRSLLFVPGDSPKKQQKGLESGADALILDLEDSVAPDAKAEARAKVAAAVSSDAVVVVGMAQNPFVKKARQALTEAGVPFTYLEFGSYLKAWKERLAIKMWSGWPTFPQVFVRGVLVGGHDDVVAMLADGSLKGRLNG